MKFLYAALTLLFTRATSVYPARILEQQTWREKQIAESIRNQELDSEAHCGPCNFQP